MEFCKKIMKLIPLFLIILFFSGALLLVYMTWATYNHNRHLVDTSSNSMIYPIAINNINQELDSSNRLTNPELRMNSYDGFVPKEIISSVDDKTFLDDEMLRNLERKKMKVISNLRRHVLNGATTIGNINEYGVSFNKLRPRNNKFDPRKIMCRIKNIKINILNHKSSSTFKDKEFPSEGLFSEYLSLNGNPIMEKATSKSQDDENDNTPLYRSCAIVPNSAALDGSKHGIDIDSHDFILRFNNAPTQGFEEDVGSLTSMRIINSQVITKEQFLFPHSSYFENEIKDELAKLNTSESNKRLEEINLSDSLWSGTRKFLAWDPCNYSASVDEWYKNPDHPIFDKYFDLTSQPEKYGKNKFYVLNCRVLWNLWDLLHEYTFAKIHGTPPTSGFIGIILAMKKCERVNVYEYIPSMRESPRCHYYGPKNESNPSCTYGSWHPVSAEKLFTYNLSDGTDKEVFMDGVLSIPGVSKFKC